MTNNPPRKDERPLADLVAETLDKISSAAASLAQYRTGSNEGKIYLSEQILIEAVENGMPVLERASRELTALQSAQPEAGDMRAFRCATANERGISEADQAKIDKVVSGIRRDEVIKILESPENWENMLGRRGVLKLGKTADAILRLIPTGGADGWQKTVAEIAERANVNSYEMDADDIASLLTGIRLDLNYLIYQATGELPTPPVTDTGEKEG